MILHTRGKSNKYNARKTTVCGRIFDSKREEEWYMILCEKQRLGKIKHVEPTYTLLEGSRDNQGNKQRAITYTADFFVTYADGRHEVIEVKGVRTRDYVLRKKLFLHMAQTCADYVIRRIVECTRAERKENNDG